MKLITLNIWGGKVYEPLMSFVEEHAKDTDVFCFQEVLFGSQANYTPLCKGRMNVCSEIEKRLPDFIALTYRAPEEAPYFESELLAGDTHPGQAIFVRKALNIMDKGGFRSYQGDIPAGADFGGKMTGSCQWVCLQDGNAEDVTIMNLHGLWQTKTEKIDTPERIAQSRVLRDFMNARNGKKILCGDFNLKPDGESIRILEQGMTNLVKKFGITSTRSGFYTKPDKFADYILVSPEIQVRHFEVLQDAASDHLPLLLDCE